MNIGRVKIQMLVNGISQRAIAKTAGVHPSVICNILRGRDRPSPRVVKAFKKHGIEVDSDDE